MSGMKQSLFLTTAPPQTLPRLSRLGWLMALYAENYQHLMHLFAPAALAPGRYLSDVGDGLELRLEVIRQHRYTTELCLTYDAPDPNTGLLDPSAWLRLYRDTQQLEVTHCYSGRCWQDVLGLHPPSAQLLQYRLQINTFLGKWLAYLAERGHSRHTLLPSPHLPVENTLFRA